MNPEMQTSIVKHLIKIYQTYYFAHIRRFYSADFQIPLEPGPTIRSNGCLAQAPCHDAHCTYCSRFATQAETVFES